MQCTSWGMKMPKFNQSCSIQSPLHLKYTTYQKCTNNQFIFLGIAPPEITTQNLWNLNQILTAHWCSAESGILNFSFQIAFFCGDLGQIAVSTEGCLLFILQFIIFSHGFDLLVSLIFFWFSVCALVHTTQGAHGSQKFWEAVS